MPALWRFPAIRRSIAATSALLMIAAAPPTAPPADLIVHNAKIWTVDPARPRAQAVAVRGNRIVAVGGEAEVLSLRGPRTRTLDAQGRLVLPGFIDAHTHFESAADWMFEPRLADVDDERLFLERIAEVVRRVPRDMWIVGGNWSDKAAAQAAKAGYRNFRPYTPALAAVDRISPDHPILVRRFDGAYFINSRGMKLLRLNRFTPNPANGAYGRDPATGALDGMLYGSAGERAEETLPPKSRARTMIGARLVLKDLARLGITGIHDIARVDDISENQTFHSHVERFASSLDLFRHLRAAGALTVRVSPLLTLRTWTDLKAHGITPGSGDEMIHFTGLKTFVDAYMMFEPFLDTPDYAGDFTFRVVDEATMERDIVGADAAGFDIGAHLTGDKAHHLYLNWLETARRKNPPRDRRHRLIHAWYPTRADIERAGRMGMIADITPYHYIRERDRMASRLGPERMQTAQAWRLLADQGVRIDIGSDMPGSFDKSEIAPHNPFENIYYITTRRKLGEKGSSSPQALTVEEAIRAYTLNPAFAAREEGIKGSISEGKLADLIVLSRDILTSAREDIPDTRVVHTIFDGRILYSEPTGR
jgi:predicted amidohydrolase YtcJ